MKNLKSDTILIIGGDGYLGWSLGLAFAKRTNKHIVLVDNLIKRKWEKQADAKLLAPYKKPNARIADYKKIFGKSNITFEKANMLNKKSVDRIIRKYNPSVIINAAQQPSAPFSMMSAKNAATTFLNNIVGHLYLLWSVAEINKDITYIKLGSAGCYMDTDTSFLPLGKKDFIFKHKGKTHKILQSFMPMQATDFYHQSKISDFLIDDLCAKIWHLKVITVQQSTIFGATIKENHPIENHGLSARFNYDAVFSTVINRFVCQIVIGHPLTIYGDGQQRTGLISLSDTIDNLIRFADMRVKPGDHIVMHNYTHRLSIEEIAERLSKIEPTVEIQYIKNPRTEPVGKLTRQVEIHDIIKVKHIDKESNLDRELSLMLEFTKLYKDSIDPAIIMPKVQWVKEEADERRRLWKLRYLNETKFQPKESMKYIRVRLSTIRNFLF